jgi:hypothetical protein
MSDAEKLAALPSVLVREAETFPDLKIEFLPLLIAPPVEDPPPDLPVPPAQDETYVTDGDQQRLMHYFLMYGPKDWIAAGIIVQDPVTPPPDNIVVINPLRRPSGSLWDSRYDGVRRMLRSDQ